MCDKRCTFSSLVSFIAIYMQWMLKVKPHSCVEQLIISDFIVYGASYHTQGVLLCNMSPHKQTQSDTISCYTHSCGLVVYVMGTMRS